MIDTDKYEGTWKIHGMEYWKHWYEGQCEADTNLIHDAPLLLAEVERLRERVATLESLMEYIAEDYEEKVIE
jgi:hypothetical protein